MSPLMIVCERLAKEMAMLELTDLHEHDRGTNRGWSWIRGEVGEEMLLGLEIMRRLTEKRSAMEARSRKLGAMAL